MDENTEQPDMPYGSRIVFFDTEVGVHGKRVCDIGAIRGDGAVLHTSSVAEFVDFISDAEYLCGHNAVHHDMEYLSSVADIKSHVKVIDTLYFSPLFFPKRPYHRLLKDDKLQVDQLNNPVNDSMKAKDLFYDEIAAYVNLSDARKNIYGSLLAGHEEFCGFFDCVGGFTVLCGADLEDAIRDTCKGMICGNADVGILARHYAVELAYALALVGCGDSWSVTPPWLLHNYPKIENVIKFLCNTPCESICPYCAHVHDIHKGLKEFFGFDQFRTYNNEPLQERAAQAAVVGKSLLAVFPTGGGKSITFQLPALMAGRAAHGLTVVISPLQSLMKDQVDNLAEKGIENAVTINGMLNPIERADAIERVMNGKAAILYISPEQLRSKTIEKLLLSRNIVRFVIDEAHCFSAWGQDFRVDYLFIGDFIAKLQKEKLSDKRPIPVSCFTATAKQKVITDICDYFKRKLDLNLEIFASSATRENLHYTVLYKETDEEKYLALRTLIEQKKCPTIVYVSRTKRTRELAEKLTADGFNALPYNGKMDSSEKIINQESFMSDKTSIIVATSAFGMGVDKSDVGLVIHYDISDSLENYVQEAGRAGRDPSLQADCYVLFSDRDLDKHFLLLNQTKLSLSEIQQVWRAIKELTRRRDKICCSALEIAREAGWDNASDADIETRVKTAISALETAGYIVRGRNVPRVYATSIRADSMIDAAAKINRSVLFTDEQRQTASRIIKSLISSRSIARAGNGDAESRVDYLADMLGLEKSAVIESISLMRQEGILEDGDDMSAFIFDSDSEKKSDLILDRFAKLERFILSKIGDEGTSFSLKEINGEALDAGIATANVKNIRKILHFLTTKNYVVKNEYRDACSVELVPSLNMDALLGKFERRIELCRFILERLFKKASEQNDRDDEMGVVFSLVELLNVYNNSGRLQLDSTAVSLGDVEDALLYLSNIGAMKLEGGFLVLYNGMEIKRLIKDNKIRYKTDDYRLLDEFYKQKIRQIHIVGEFANMMVRDYKSALAFVQDYFHLDFKKFISTYFKGTRAKEIERNITPAKYHELFDSLSDIQSEIINDKDSKYIVVAAGPGSGKTRVLVHKLASLLLLEDVKHEQLLMLTFSRAAATEFKKKLVNLIGNAANFVEIKTFHSYSFDLLGRVGSLEESGDVVKNAARMIRDGDVERERITKKVLVVDEAQDMDGDEFSLVQALMEANDDMRIIAVGDDDQNIYEFRGSSSKYLSSLVTDYGAKKYEMTENYRSKPNVVALANAFARTIRLRMKSASGVAVRENMGSVQLVRHKCPNMEEAVVWHIVKSGVEGGICVLTNTNDEATRILGLLIKNKRRARLIQSLDGFMLRDLLEIRAFLKAVDIGRGESPIILDDVWKSAKEKTFSTYGESECIGNVKRMLSDFEATHPKKYRSDFIEFLNESDYGDFYDKCDAKTIFVSTVHKSKGREFDNVFMLLKDVRGVTDEERRKIYVGLTRAKNNLFVHTNTDIFADCGAEGVDFLNDDTEYGEPEEIVLQTTHKNMYLNFFKGKKSLLFKLRSGTPLTLEQNGCLSATVDGCRAYVAKLAWAFADELKRLGEKGYVPFSSKVMFIVAWKGQDDEDESAVLLAEIRLRKKT